MIYFVLIPLAALNIAEYSGIMEQIKYKLFYWIYTKNTKYVPFSIRPLDCPLCLSFWIGVLVTIKEYSQLTDLLLPFAASTVTVILDRIVKRLY